MFTVLVHIHTMENYITVNINDLKLQQPTWIKLTILRRRKSKKEYISYAFTYLKFTNKQNESIFSLGKITYGLKPEIRSRDVKIEKFKWSLPLGDEWEREKKDHIGDTRASQSLDISLLLRLGVQFGFVGFTTCSLRVLKYSFG